MLKYGYSIFMTSYSKLKTKQQARSLHAHTADVYALELLPASPLPEITALGNLVSAGDYTIRTWDINTGGNLAALHGHTGKKGFLRIMGYDNKIMESRGTVAPPNDQQV
ncbi:hypothetical protein HDU97_007675 [Phlyctochytrium planicorne]|nr:hypothetical protein HDU97_007675 [Phlyctochytrium planicorne]